MNLVFIAALLAACSAGKLDRTYLPPASSLSAGGTPGIFNTFNSEGVNTLIPGLQAPFQRTNDKNPRGNQVPSGSYENEHDGVVVDAAAPGTRASNQPSGLGGPRVNYGSTDSKVGAAAFRGTKNQAAYATNESGKLNAFQSQAQFGNQPQGQNVEPDLSAFYQPTGQKPTSSSNPGIQIFKDPGSSTLQYYNNIGLNRFDYGYETENGIKSAERGVSINGVMTQGSYSYMGDDGKVYSIVYTADKDGFRPTGSHLPTPPPIPAEIMESLQQNAKDEANGIYDDGSYDAQKYNAGDDYAQSDANDNYNDRQSNKFGGRPGYGDVGNTFINQAQQGFVRPNVQGHVSSYDYSNSKGLSIQPDNSFGAGASGFDNTKQMNKFFNQPGFFAGASSFNNQQSGSVSPNAQGQFSTNDFSNSDHSSTQHDTFKFGTGVSGFDNTKPSNTLLNQPGFNSGAKTFNNQGQQEFVRPNVQGHVSSYDYSNSKGLSMQSDTTFGTGGSGFDNIKQTNKFLNQPEFFSGASSFNNQQSGSVKPIAQGQFSTNDFSNSDHSSTQHDTSRYGTGVTGFDNSKQSNTFGELPNSNKGAGTLFNQGQQGFARPSAQEQFSLSTRNLSLEKPDSPKLGTGDSGYEITKPPIKFGERPGSETSVSSDIFMNQDKQGIAQPNSQGQFISYDFSKDSLSTQPDTTKYSTSENSFDKTSNQADRLNQNGQNTEVNNRFGSQFQYLPPVGNSQDSKPFQVTEPFKSTDDKNFNRLLSDQKLQNQEFLGNPSTTQIKPSHSFEPFISNQGSLNNPLVPSSSDLNNFSTNNGAKNDALSLSTPEEHSIGVAPTQEIVNKSPQNQGLSFSTDLESSGDIRDQNTNPNLSNTFSSSVLPHTLPTKQPEFTLTTPLENQERQTNSATSELGLNNVGNVQSFLTNNQKPNDSQFDNTFLQQSQVSDESYIYNKPSNPFIMPSVQPDLNKSTGIISSQFNSVTQPFQVSIFSTQNQDLSESTKYPQPPTLAPITPTVATSKDGEIGKSTYQINGVTQATISSFPFITPTSSSQMHSGEVYEYTKPDQGLQKENTRESNSEVVKQSSLQSPQEEDPIKPQINENTQFGQEYPTPSTSSFGQPTTPFIFSPQTGSTFAKQPISQPQLVSQSSFLFGQPTTLSRFDALTSTSLNQQTTPTRFGDLTSSSFGQKPTLPSYESQTSTSFYEETKSPQFSDQTSSPFGQQSKRPQTSYSLNQNTSPIQTSSSYGQKPTQGKIMEQTSFSFGSQTTPSRFGAITSTSFNQQTTPSPFRVQTSSTFGQKTTQSQLADTSFSLGSQTTSSRFGDLTNPSFGQKSSGQTNLSFGSQTTPSRFGAVISTSLNQQTTPSSLSIPSSFQTSSTFEQTTIQSQAGGQRSVSFGSQTIPSHSAVPISTSFGQRTTPSRLGTQSSLSTAQEIIPSPFPSHFGVPASSTFEPKPTQSQLDGQTGVSFGLQTTLSRFGAPVTTSFGQQTTPSRSGVQSSLSTAQQTTPSTLSPTGALFRQKITPSLLNIPTGSVSGQQTTPSKTGAQSSSFTSQQLTTSPFSEQTSSAFGQKIIPSRFYNSTSEQQSITQIGDGQRKNENSVGTQLQESNKQSETQSDFKPLPSLAITSNSEESSDEIYQYNKPTTSFPSNDGNNTQLNFGLQPSQAINQLGQQSNGLIETNGITLVFDDKQSQLLGIKPNNQFGLKAEQPNNQQLQGTHLDQQSVLQSEEESFSALTKTEVASQQNQHYQEKTPPRFSQQQKVTNLPFASQTTPPSITPTSSSEQSFDSKETTTFQFSSTSPDNTQTISQKKDQSQNSQSGEVYHYEKPSQTFPETFLIVNNRLGQKQESAEEPAQNKIDLTKPITSHLSPSYENLNNVKLPTQDPDVSLSQTDNKLQSGSIQDTLPSSKPFNSRPQFIYSACCQGLKTQNSEGLQSFSSKAPSDTRLNANFGFNKNDNHVSNTNGVEDNKFSNIGSGIQDSGAQKETTSFIGKGEEFGGPPNPPKFDETGYHY